MTNNQTTAAAANLAAATAERDAATAALASARADADAAAVALAEYQDRLRSGLATTATTMAAKTGAVSHSAVVVGYAEERAEVAEAALHEATIVAVSETVAQIVASEAEEEATLRARIEEVLTPLVAELVEVLEAKNVRIREAVELAQEGGLPDVGSDSYKLSQDRKTVTGLRPTNEGDVLIAHKIPSRADHEAGLWTRDQGWIRPTAANPTAQRLICEAIDLDLEKLQKGLAAAERNPSVRERVQAIAGKGVAVNPVRDHA